MMINGNNSNQSNFAKGHFENPNSTKLGSSSFIIMMALFTI